MQATHTTQQTMLLYRGSWQLTKVRVFMWFALLCAAGTIC